MARSFGARAALTLTAPVALAGEDALPPLPPADVHYALFALAATPERENHGAFILALKKAGAQALGVLVDDGGFSARFGGARAGERRRAWQQLAGEIGVATQFVDLSTIGDTLLAAPGEEAA